MKPEYPIVKIDRTTMQEFMPLLTNKGLFSNYLSLPIKDEILETEKKRLGVTELTPDQQRKVLAAAGQYRSDKYVFRDFGNYTIVFSPKLFADYLGEVENFLDNEPSNVKIESTLKRIKLYKLEHRLVLIILSKVYEKRSYEKLEITKQELLQLLGYHSAEKQIYKDLRDAMFSLTMLNYQIFHYRTKNKIDPNSKALGLFLYNVVETPKAFFIDVNKNFVGCVVSLLKDKSENTVKDFVGGYFDYPTAIIPATRKYSTAAYLLTNYLISEEGNNKLNNMDYKVIAFNIRRFMLVMNIKSSRASKRKADFIKALQEVEIISEISPSLDDLTNLTPSMLEETLVYIKVRREIKELDSYIKSNLLGAKCG